MLNDTELLASMDAKLTLVRDRVTGVVEGYSNGLYLWGEGGTSKSYSVEETLNRLGKAYKVTNSRISGKGLFSLLRDMPDTVHMLEDLETLFGDKHSFGVLRSALWGQTNSAGRQERVVVWQTDKGRDEFIFTGAVILIANRPLDDVPELRAVKTRIPVIHYQPTNEEVAALMRKIARKGHRLGTHVLSAEECLEVADEITSRSQRLQRNLDLRLLVNSLNDRLQWANGASETHWLDLLASRMAEKTVTPSKPLSRASRKAGELAIVREIAGLPPQQRLDAWQKRTGGKSQAALYRRLSELGTGGSHFSHFLNQPSVVHTERICEN